MIEKMVIADTGPVTIHPADRLEEILQNVRTILTTPKGSVPLHRDFGLDFDVLDRPTPKAQALVTTDVVRQVGRYEPRCDVTRVVWDKTAVGDAMDGRMIPTVLLKIDEKILP